MVNSRLTLRSDVRSQISFQLEDGEACAEEHKVAFIETSAKTSYNVKRLFQMVAKSLTSKRLNFLQVGAGKNKVYLMKFSAVKPPVTTENVELKETPAEIDSSGCAC